MWYRTSEKDRMGSDLRLKRNIIYKIREGSKLSVWQSNTMERVVWGMIWGGGKRELLTVSCWVGSVLEGIRNSLVIAPGCLYRLTRGDSFSPLRLIPVVSHVGDDSHQ
jgi:hypothetical protein